jgi:hypothetical protein
MPIPGNLLTTVLAVIPHRDVDQIPEAVLSVDIAFWPRCPDPVITKTYMSRPRSILTSWWKFVKRNQDFPIKTKALQTVQVSHYGLFRKQPQDIQPDLGLAQTSHTK